MISVSNKKWSEINFDKNKVNKFSQDNNFSQILSKLIVFRKFTEEEIHSISSPKNLKFTNIFKFNADFVKAIKLVTKSINNNDKICILGDYDVDGSCSASLIIKFLMSINHPFTFYIPDRQKDGYGPSINLFKKLIKKKPKLMIMVDCGSNANEAIDFLNKNNINSLIIDHHQINKPFPKANTIINPKKDNGYIKYDYLCATLLTYFFIDLLKQKIKANFILEDYLIYPLLGTVCDVMPLRNINRLLAIKTLSDLNINKVLSIKILYDLLKIKNKLSIYDLGYLLGPILNAGGRLGNSDYAVKFLSYDNEGVIKSIGEKLINLNNNRKKFEQKILNSIDYKKIEKKNKNVIIYYDPTINEGLIGIIAARLKDIYNKPAIVLTNSKDLLKGSARSIFSFDIGLVIKNALDRKLILKGGGHKMAAGFSITKDKLQIFDKFVNNYYSKFNNDVDNRSFFYDAKISSNSLKRFLFEEINKLNPFGTENPEPLFLLEKLKITKVKIVGKKHISNFFVSQNGFFIQAISFNSINEKVGKYLLNYKKEINVVGFFKENFWNNKKKLQLIVRDLII